jgi:hypothetical protein
VAASAAKVPPGLKSPPAILPIADAVTAIFDALSKLLGINCAKPPNSRFGANPKVS